MTIVLIRHAERTSGTDPGLTAAGAARARHLAGMLEDAGISAIFTSTLRRSKETAAPLAEAIQVAPAVLDDDVLVARQQILSSGAAALVVGHTDTVPALISTLGGPNGVSIADDEFDRFFVLTVAPADGGSLFAMRYGVPNHT
jgi:phosphohistidine phosphatase SixA